jgi:hypothetical protein
MRACGYEVLDIGSMDNKKAIQKQSTNSTNNIFKNKI